MSLPLVFPPSSLPKFLVTGHGIELGDDYAGVPRGTGHSRKRRKSTGAPRTVSVVWRLTQAQMADLHYWFENTLIVGVEEFTAEVANQGPGQMFWRAKWVSPYRAEPQPTPRGLLWTVTGSIRLFGEGEATRPITGELSGLILIPRLGSASMVLPETPLAGIVTIARIAITPLAGIVYIPRTSTILPLSGQILIPRTGSGTISAGGSSPGGGSLTIEEEDGTPTGIPSTLIVPNGSLFFDSNGNAHLVFSPNIWSYGPTPHLSPTVGDQWTDSDVGIEYRYIDDGSSTQWVEF